MWPEAQADEVLVGDADFGSTGDEQAALEEAFVFQHKAGMQFRKLGEPRKVMEAAGEANGMLVENGEPTSRMTEMDRRMTQELAARLRAADPEPPVETIPGDEELEFLPLASMESMGAPQAKKLDDFDVAYEVERLLRHRKWEQRDGPFSGFQSPPGRF